jgi:hypothetical protein
MDTPCPLRSKINGVETANFNLVVSVASNSVFHIFIHLFIYAYIHSVDSLFQSNSSNIMDNFFDFGGAAEYINNVTHWSDAPMSTISDAVKTLQWAHVHFFYV